MEKIMQLFEKFDLKKIKRVAIVLTALVAALDVFLVKLGDEK